MRTRWFNIILGTKDGGRFSSSSSSSSGLVPSMTETDKETDEEEAEDGRVGPICRDD